MSKQEKLPPKAKKDAFPTPEGMEGLKSADDTRASSNRPNTPDVEALMANTHTSPEIPGIDEDRTIIANSYRDLLKAFKLPLNEEDQKNIRRAFEMAAKAHQTQRRKSGEPYITHPIEVALICVEEIGLGPTAVVCALLHDVVEDTDIPLKEIHNQFGEKVARIVDGLTKLDEMQDSESPQAENLSKVLKAMLFDVRVVLIKMADRLHNLRTIKSMTHEKQLKIAAETSFIYTPLAHRLGLNKIKTEFQDSCLKITQPEAYQEIAQRLSETKRARQEYINEFTGPLRERLKEIAYPIEIVGRPKSIYSIYNKIKTKKVPFEDIYDLFAVRIIVKVPADFEKNVCWQIYSLVTDAYRPVTERIKDWISTPKANGYESLHTTVVGPKGRYVEVQIRSARMDDIAERGFAAHWKYKGIPAKNNLTNSFENWLLGVRESLENEELGSALEFLSDFQSYLYHEEIHVFTPKGDMKILADGATALDFAFAIHSDIGCTCRAVKVNNIIAPFSQVLKNGDQVEVVTDKSQKPSEDWLQFVVSSKAKNRIRAALSEVKRGQADLGREILERKLKSLKVHFEENIDSLVKFYAFANRIEFLSAIYLDIVKLDKIRKNFDVEGTQLILKKEKREAGISEKKLPASKQKSPPRTEVHINNEPGNLYKYTFATCCNPMAGDEIFALILAQGGLKIHRKDCLNASFLYAQHSHRILKASWGNVSKTDFLANISITGIDIGAGAIGQLTNSLAEMGYDMRSFSISGEKGYFTGKISMIVANSDHLQQAIIALKKFPWVSNVSRTD